MIFVTVGAQIPFDRMIRAVDEWAGQHKKVEVFAQIGRSDFRPRHMFWAEFLDPPEFRRYFKSAAAVVAHAGMGSIITALELGKPILVMPRRGDLDETRNNHQVATARHFAELGYLAVAMDEEELPQKLDQLDQVAAGPVIGPRASPELLAALRQFVGQEVHTGILSHLLRRPVRKPSVTPVHRV